MTGTITALRLQKHNRDRVNVYLDGRFAFGLPAIVAARLRVGQTLSEDEIKALRGADDIERAYERALDFLSYRPRSEAEVRRRLQRQDLSEDTVEAVVERLLAADLLNDEEFARYWVENRAQFRPRGTAALRYELRRKGLSDAAIEAALEGADEERAARQAAERAARRLAHLPVPEFRRRLAAYLARRGFSYAVIQPLVEELLAAGCCESRTEPESEE
jgi:regulatory protein